MSARIPAPLALLALLLAAGAARAAPFPEDQCAVIMASRPDMAAASAWVAANPQHPADAIYRSSNGQLAISAGLIARADWRAGVAQLKAEGRVPEDSFCSGRGMVEAVWTQGQPLPAANANASAAPSPAPAGPDAFDARPLSRLEKTALQAAMSLAGTYDGLLDGAWGSGSQRALDAYAQKRFGRDATGSDADAALEDFAARMRAGGWSWADPSGENVPLLLPLKGLAADNSEPGRVNFEGPDLLVIIDNHDAADATGVHASFEEIADGTPYVLRNDNLLITAGEDAEVGRFYLRSDRRHGRWITTLVSGSGEASGHNLIAASIGTMDRPALPGLGTAPPEVAPDRAPQPPAEGGGDGGGGGSSSGTGFRVAADGTILTNHHVIAECTTITADGVPARLRSSDADVDLAILDAPIGAGKPFLSFSPDPPRLNTDVTVVGYPFLGILGGINVTRGSISALRGLGGDETTMQMTAPIQAGNSGGPVADSQGRVVGVVVSQIDEEAIREETGRSAQNINFAVRGDIARKILADAGVPFQTAPSGTPLAPEDLADRITAATVLITCE